MGYLLQSVFSNTLMNIMQVCLTGKLTIKLCILHSSTIRKDDLIEVTYITVNYILPYFI